MSLFTNIIVMYVLVTVMDAMILPFDNAEAFDGDEDELIVRCLHEDGQENGLSHLKETLTFDLYSKHDGHTLLHLQRNTNINVMKPIYVMRDGQIVPQYLPPFKYIEYYQDMVGNAAFGVFCEMTANGTRHYALEGLISKGNSTYLIYPKGGLHSMGVMDDRDRHVARRINGTFEYQADFLKAGSNMKFSKTYPDRQRLKRQGLTTYKVEVLMVVDYAVYEYWYSRTSASSTSSRDSLTKEAIRQYYAFMYNGIDLRYRAIQESDMAFHILFSGLYIADSPSASPWTEDLKTDNPDNPSRPRVPSDQALYDLGSWVQLQTGLPDFDHAMAFTGFDLLGINSGPGNLGLAYVGSVCSIYALSIQENLFNFLGLIVAAHELGHNLGAYHDGYDNACSSSDQFIMSSSTGGAQGATALNPWEFSNCTLQYFRDNMATLGSGSCLLSESPLYDPHSLDGYLGIQVGQMYDADTQCSYALGGATSVCRGAYDADGYRNVCEGLYCNMLGDSGGCIRIYAGRGLSCGFQMWCIDGVCVQDPAAPAVADACPFGDQKEPLPNGLTCAQLPEEEPFDCYFYPKQCCESCLGSQTGDPDCIHGDRNSDCPNVFRGDCYKNHEICCGTCPTFYDANSPGCEYGDEWSGCEESHCEIYSTSVKAYCCETCATAVTIPSIQPSLRSNVVSLAIITFFSWLLLLVN